MDIRDPVAGARVAGLCMTGEASACALVAGRPARRSADARFRSPERGLAVLVRRRTVHHCHHCQAKAKARASAVHQPGKRDDRLWKWFAEEKVTRRDPQR